MSKLTLKEIKEIELNILRYIDRVCKEEQLNYYLCGGTLLGAIRHQGFIPWDDDIDIFMPREDYERLLIILNEKKNNYRVLNYRTEKEFYLPFTKVVDKNTFLKERGVPEIKTMGVFVDIFPIDGIHENKIIMKIQYYSILILKKILACKVNDGNLRNHNKIRVFIRGVIKFLLQPVSLRSINLCIDKISKIYKYQNSNLCVVFSGSYGKKEIFNKNKLFSLKCKAIFENYKFFIPQGFDYYLGRIYGNYMKLPPIEEQKSNHFIEVCYKR